MIITQTDVIQVETVEALEYFYSKFKTTCDKHKEDRGDRFQFDINPDYDKLELEVTLKFLEAEDDNTERDPQLN